MSKGLEKLALIQKVFEKLAEWNAYDLAKLDKDYETNFDLDFLELEKELKEHEQHKAIEEELGIDLMTFLKGVDPDICFMEITKDKKFYFCGDAYYGDYTKEGLLELIQELLFMYWKLKEVSK